MENYKRISLLATFQLPEIAFDSGLYIFALIYSSVLYVCLLLFNFHLTKKLIDDGMKWMQAFTGLWDTLEQRVKLFGTLPMDRACNGELSEYWNYRYLHACAFQKQKEGREFLNGNCERSWLKTDTAMNWMCLIYWNSVRPPVRKHFCGIKKHAKKYV